MRTLKHRDGRNYFTGERLGESTQHGVANPTVAIFDVMIEYEEWMAIPGPERAVEPNPVISRPETEKPLLLFLVKTSSLRFTPQHPCSSLPPFPPSLFFHFFFFFFFPSLD